MTHCSQTGRTAALILAAALSSSATPGSSAAAAERAPSRWGLRVDGTFALFNVELSSDSPGHTIPVPVGCGQAVIGYSLERASFEYGVGGPLLAQSLGARIRPLGYSRGGHAVYLGTQYHANFSGDRVAQFVLADVGYEYAGRSGWSFIGGAGLYGIPAWFKPEDPTTPVGFWLRLGVGHRF